MKRVLLMIFALVLMILTLCCNMQAFAESDGLAVISFGSAKGIAEDIIEVKLSLKSNVPVGLVAVGPIEFNKNGLEYVGFEYDESVVSLINEELSGMDEEKMALVVLFKENEAYNVCLGTFRFKIKDGATKEELISANSSAQTKEGVSVPTKLEPGEVTVEVNNDGDNVPEMTSSERAADVVVLKIDNALACAFGKMTQIDEENEKVVPYIYNERTLVPLRFVSENLGAEVQWEDGWDYCFIKKDGKQIKITFNSADIEVDGEVITYDAPIQVVEGRTMVPVRFISEELGYHVHWNNPNKLVVISPASNPWVKERKAEDTLLREVLITLLMRGKLQ